MKYYVEINEYSVDTEIAISADQVKNLTEGEGYDNLRTYEFSDLDAARAVYFEACKNVQAIKEGDFYNIIAASLIEEDSDDEGLYRNTLEEMFPEIKKEA